MANNEPTTFYYGHREDVIREVGGLTHIYPGKYLIQPDGPAAYDADGAGSKAELKALLAEYRRLYPNADFVRL
jgi:hypothetical protein